MCGIFGLAGKWTTTQSDDKFIKNCTIAGVVRGGDGTGFVFMNEEKKTTFLKKGVNGATFVTDVFDPSWNIGNKTHSIIGHNRAATSGDINDDTTHPFIEGNVIGVHNGTLNGDWRGDLQVSKKCDVDSKGIYRSISARGIDWTIEHLYGAAALVWSDLKTQQLFVYRNHERPLYYTQNAAKTKVYYASEKGMLQWLLGKCHIAHGEVHPFKAETLYEITGGEVTEIRELKKAKRVVAGYQPRGTTTSRTIPSTYTQTGKKLTVVGTTGNTAMDGKLLRLTGPIFGHQDGIKFRGPNMSRAELLNGIVGEYAERGFHKYTCFNCDIPIISSSFLESTQDGDVKIHHTCLDEYRSKSDPKGSLISILRNSKLRGVVSCQL